MKPAPTFEVLTLDQAAATLGVSNDEVKAMVARGELAGRKFGHRYRFSHRVVVKLKKNLAQRAARRASAKGGVYFVQAGQGGPIKIGHASNIKLRLSNLQLANPEKLHLLRVLDGEGAAREKELHRRFAKLKIRGEWFRPEHILLTFIEHGDAAPFRLPHRPEVAS